MSLMKKSRAKQMPTQEEVDRVVFAARTLQHLCRRISELEKLIDPLPDALRTVELTRELLLDANEVVRRLNLNRQRLLTDKDVTIFEELATHRLFVELKDVVVYRKRKLEEAVGYNLEQGLEVGE